ncbi:hypothetical protein CBS147323_9143 [Aspergillus niger]|nr:hypothetical protein CBS13152_11179 [Aspergillus niger]KAI2956726.1 hypothetical protein CBS147323_9143 [Aspergillus niger]
MPTRDTRAGRAETRTPEAPDRDEREESPPRLRPKRVTRPPNNYAREQEEEATRYALGSQTERRGRGRPKTRNETAAERVDSSEDETETGNSNPQTTELLAELVKLRREIKRRDETHTHREELREVKTQFTEALSGMQQELAELRNELATSQTNHDETLREIQSLRTSIITTDPTDNLSYADVARTPPTSQPSNIRTLSSSNTTPTTLTDTLYCTINTSKMADNENDRASAGPIRAAVENEIRAMENHTNWRCRAVTLVKKAAEATIGAGARVLRDDLYPIKVDSVRKTAVLDENNEVRVGAAAAFSEENEATVAKIAWLSRKESAKAYGSMVVYLTKGTNARRLLAEGFFHAVGESGVTSAFEHRPRPTQCYNCQEIGHKAFQCNNAQKCAKCAKEGHRHSICKETVLKCVPCGGPHESYSRNCRKLYPVQHE